MKGACSRNGPYEHYPFPPFRLFGTCSGLPLAVCSFIMIGRLTGKISEKGSGGILLDVGGVGYEITLPLGTLAALPDIGESVALYIHTHVREDELRLFGFDSAGDKTAFLTMLKVSGVGPKLALAILGALSGQELARVINESDTRRLTAIPGIGKKSAERLILELSGKLKADGPSTPTTGPGIFTELGFALQNLGFKAATVDQVLSDIRSRASGDEPFEKLLREALGLLKEK